MYILYAQKYNSTEGEMYSHVDCIGRYAYRLRILFPR